MYISAVNINKHQQAIPSTSQACPSTSMRGGTSDVLQRSFMLFPESNVSVRMKMHQAEFLITGRADWAMGYKAMGDEGSLLNAIVMKQRSEFSKGEAQLTAYLAILRENPRKAKKVNHRIQRFYSEWYPILLLVYYRRGHGQKFSHLRHRKRRSKGSECSATLPT